jgi:hypothetical protein
MRVSTAIRTAVLTAGVSCGVRATNHQLKTADSFATFCAWLPGYASLVSQLDTQGVGRGAAADQLLSLALQLCAQQATQLSATAADQTTPTGLARPVQQLRLKVFKCASMSAPAALDALSNLGSLTGLDIKGLTSADPSAVMCCSLGRLTGMQSLHLCQSSNDDAFPAHLGKALSALQGLQELRLVGCVQPQILTQLPAQLCFLILAVRPAAAAGDAAVCVNLSQLTQLTRLHLNTMGEYSEQSELPSSIVHLSLHLRSPRRVQPTLRLPQLRRLHYSDKHMDELRPQLSAVPDLQDLKISCVLAHTPLSSAFSRSLSEAMAAVTQLTRLCLRVAPSRAFPGQYMPASADAELLLRDTLRQLPALRSLAVASFNLQPSDVIQWPTLSGLTDLEVRQCPTLGDAAAAALACKLTALQKLELSRCGLQSPVLWPAISSCSGLQALCLTRNELVVNDDTLVMLAALTQLTSLDLQDLQVVVSDEGRARFRSAMPRIAVVMGGLL